MTQTFTAHIVKTEKFEGPIGVLYGLIEDRKLSVSDFSLVTITEDFINYVKSLGQENFSKEEISNFISVASLLILLKSKSLIPELELTNEEDRDILILENQLKAFETLKAISKTVASAWQKQIFISANVKAKHENNLAIFIPDSAMTIPYFNQYIVSRLEEITPKEIESKEVKVHKTLKIEDALSHVRQIIKRIKSLNFKNLGETGDERLKDKNKRNVVILFLAVLELVKIGEIDAIQDNNFGDILVEESI